MTPGPTRSRVVLRPLIDHVMVLLDDTAHRDVLATDFLGERFGRVKPKSADSSVAGQYSTFGVAGEHTLLELFGATMPGPRRLTGGLVFTFEHADSALAARQLLADEAGIGAHHQLVQRVPAGGGPQQPWYHLVSADLGATSPVLLFLNEVTPEYYLSLGARPGPDGELRRAEYLDAVLGTKPAPDHLLKDITGVTLRLRAERVDRVATVLTTLGYARVPGTGATVVQGPGLTLHLVGDDTAPEGVTEVRMALTGVPGAATEHHFGTTSRLLIGPDAQARWSFSPTN